MLSKVFLEGFNCNDKPVHVLASSIHLQQCHGIRQTGFVIIGTVILVQVNQATTAGLLMIEHSTQVDERTETYATHQEK